MKTRSYVWQGIAPILVASLLWAIGYFLRKLIFTSISAICLAFLTASIVACVLPVLFRLNPFALRQTLRRYPAEIFGLGFFGVAIGTTSMFLALSMLPLGLTLILEKLQAIFIVILAYFFLNEKLPLIKIPYIITALVGSLLVTSPRLDFHADSINPLGIVAVIVAALSWALASILGRRVMQHESAMHVTTLRFFTGGVFLLPVIILSNEKFPAQSEMNVWLVVLGSAIFCTALGYLLFYHGLKVIPASVSGFLELVTPVFGAGLGYLFLDEKFSFLQLIGAIVLLGSVYVISIPNPDRKKVS